LAVVQQHHAAGPHDTAIIDTGYVSHAPQTLELVRHAPHGRHLDQIINTHLHSDHCGGNAILQAHYGCKTSIPVAEADKVRHWDVEALSFKATASAATASRLTLPSRPATC
jgi:glyoxylase-like metal-dependent hydrolase (beta-lactamase superfamily II)